jgi:hypothetical protein
VEDLLERAVAGAADRGLLIVEATFTTDPSVWFHHQSVTVDQVLDLAHSMDAPFISVEHLEFDLAEFVADGDDDDEDDADLQALPQELRALEAHNGSLSSLFVRWIHNGAVFMFVVQASWYAEATNLRDAWLAQDETHRQDVRSARLARAAELGEKLEQLVEFRSAPTRARKAKGEQLIKSIANPSDDEGVIIHAVRLAVQDAALNSQIQFHEISMTITEAGVGLAATEQWKKSHQSPAQLAAARQFLIERSGGYSPTEALVKQMRNTALDVKPEVLRLGRK